MLTEAAELCHGWLMSKGLKLAVQKSEAMIITKKRNNKDLSIHINDDSVMAKRNLRYLGLQLD